MAPLRITVCSARGLQTSPFRETQTVVYCVCGVVNKPHTARQTAITQSTGAVTWNQNFVLDEYRDGENLEFCSVETSHRQDIVGTAVLQSQQFAHFGFDGELTLASQTMGIRCLLRVSVSSASTFAGDSVAYAISQRSGISSSPRLGHSSGISSPWHGFSPRLGTPFRGVPAQSPMGLSEMPAAHVIAREWPGACSRAHVPVSERTRAEEPLSSSRTQYKTMRPAGERESAARAPDVQAPPVWPREASYRVSREVSRDPSREQDADRESWERDTRVHDADRGFRSNMYQENSASPGQSYSSRGPRTMELERERIRVTIISASNLPQADLLGKSDPYVVCEVPGKPQSKYETAVIQQDLNPVWNESYEVTDFAQGDSLEFTVWDKDPIKSDDFLGTVSLSSDFFYPNGLEDLTLTLLDSSGREDGDASLRLRIEVVNST